MAITIEKREDVLESILEDVNQKTDEWRNTLSVSIGRASMLTGLKETQIRYFEELGALQPEKNTSQTGSSRLYTLTDLRRLYVLARLIDNNYRPKEATTILIANTQVVDREAVQSLSPVLEQERTAIEDGFLLARLMSQLIDAIQVTFMEHSAQRDKTPFVLGIVLVKRSVEEDVENWSLDKVQQFGRKICATVGDMPVALVETSDHGEEREVQPHSGRDPVGRNDRSVLFYSRESWALPNYDKYYYAAYSSKNRDLPLILIMLDMKQSPNSNHILNEYLGDRITFLDQMLGICKAVFAKFRNVATTKNFRYRSDGFDIEQTKSSYQRLLETISKFIFPRNTEQETIAVLFLPDNLDSPTRLSVLASVGYDELGLRVKLDLSGDGQGLSGRAYKQRTPFSSLDPSHDLRVAYASEEGCQEALAVPLTTNSMMPPFGVLYVASTRSGALDSYTAYGVLILGNILSELLGRWWLTRLRRARDLSLHENYKITSRWLGNLDQHGQDFQAALDYIQSLWYKTKTYTRKIALDECLALIVFDIDNYGASVQFRSHEPFLPKAQVHVENAIKRVLPGIPTYWFKNDHVLVILEKDQIRANDLANYEEAIGPEITERVVTKIINQVSLLPLDIHGSNDRRMTINVKASAKLLSYAELLALDDQGGEKLRGQLQLIIDDLREQAGVGLEPGNSMPSNIVRRTPLPQH